ncbi:cache domain-containing protein [Pectinatus sottacetonis]|uniref:cache domain-containing protein n=1 Tax=Pectinatus sottacetonis TaxID=1002795 RepID=UPI0018C4DD3A|nr:cache domain-containing protein [Pectinatus sottacetonis]
MKGLMHKQVYDDAFRLASIRTRLLLIMLVLMFMSLGLFTAISYYFSDKALTKSVNSNAAAIGADYANRTYGFLNGLTVYIKDVAANPHIVHPENKNQIVEALDDSLQRNHHFSGMNYIDLEGNMIRADGSTAYIGNREYYKKVLQTKKVVISEPILSRESGRKSLAISAPIMYKGQLRAVIQGTMPLDSLMKFVNKIKFMDTGYGFIVNQSGVIIAHKLHPEMNGKINLLQEQTAMGKKISEMDTRLITLLKTGLKSDKPVHGIYDSKHGAIFTVFTPLDLPGGTRWLVAVSAPEKEVTGPISSLNKVLLLTAFGCILMGALIVLLISKRFARPEEKYFKAFKNVADAIGIINLGNERIIEVNDAFYKILGYEHNEIVGKTSRELNLWDDRQRKTIYEALRREKSVYGVECFWYTKNRDRRTGMLSADAIKIGDDFYAVFIWHDVTVQKQSELKLKQAYDAMEQKVEERTQELFAANQELTAMNEEMTAINEELAQSNDNLHEENHIRQQTEDKLLLREKQYRATTNLLIRSTNDNEQLTATIMSNAIQLVAAESGFIGSYIKDGQSFVIHYGMGKYKKLMAQEIIVEEGPLKTLYNEGRVIHDRDRWHYNGQQSNNDTKFANMIFVPLKQNQAVKGLLVAAWNDKYEIPLEDIEVLQQFAD